jgi:hypothetical protein
MDGKKETPAMKLSDFTEEQRAFIGGLCFEATMQERERCAADALRAERDRAVAACEQLGQRVTTMEEALHSAREYIVEDRGGEPSPTARGQVDYATIVLDKIDAAMGRRAADGDARCVHCDEGHQPEKHNGEMIHRIDTCDPPWAPCFKPAQ